MWPNALSMTGQNSSGIANVVIEPTRPFDQNTFMSPPEPIIDSRNASSARLPSTSASVNGARGIQMFEDAQVQHLGIAQHVPNAENRHIRLVGQPVTPSRTPSKMAARPPEFGEQTEEVLAEFGFTAEEIGALRRAKIV